MIALSCLSNLLVAYILRPHAPMHVNKVAICIFSSFESNSVAHAYKSYCSIQVFYSCFALELSKSNYSGAFNPAITYVVFYIP